MWYSVCSSTEECDIGCQRDFEARMTYELQWRGNMMAVNSEGGRDWNKGVDGCGELATILNGQGQRTRKECIQEREEEIAR